MHHLKVPGPVCLGGLKTSADSFFHSYIQKSQVFYKTLSATLFAFGKIFFNHDMQNSVTSGWGIKLKGVNFSFDPIFRVDKSNVET